MKHRTAGAADRARVTALSLSGVLLVAVGLGLLAVAWRGQFWTGVETALAQKELKQAELVGVPHPAAGAEDPTVTVQGGGGADEGSDPAAAARVGDAYALLRIPRLGADWSWAVVEGIGVPDLTNGPGHYPRSAAPGQVGNFAVAGHRATHGAPFAHLDALRPGDTVQVDRGGVRYSYTVQRSFVTDADDTGVVLPVPGYPHDEPQQRLITLTTCHPRWSTERRLIVTGLLTRQQPLPS